MSEQTKRTGNPDPNAISKLFSRGRLVWRLLGDRRVPVILKTLPVLTLLYVLSPVDAIPEFLLPALGPLVALDDIAVILLGLNFFVRLAPPDVVSDHERGMAAQSGWTVDDDEKGASSGDASAAENTPPVVDGSFRVVKDDER